MGGVLAQSPFPTGLGCAVSYGPPLEKKMVEVEKKSPKTLPRNAVLAFSSPVVLLLFPEWFDPGFVLLCPAGSCLGAFPLPLFPPVSWHPGISQFDLFFRLNSLPLPRGPCQTLAQLPVSAPSTASPRARSERWVQRWRQDAPGER